MYIRLTDCITTKSCIFFQKNPHTPKKHPFSLWKSPIYSTIMLFLLENTPSTKITSILISKSETKQKNHHFLNENSTLKKKSCIASSKILHLTRMSSTGFMKIPHLLNYHAFSLRKYPIYPNNQHSDFKIRN